MTKIPKWARSLKGTLRQSFSDVWQRLPDHARVTLDALQPAILLVSDGEMDKFGSDEMGMATLANIGGVQKPAVLFRESLAGKPDVIRRYIIVHELAHMFLHHHEFGRFAPLAMMNDDEKRIVHDFHEEHSDWMVFHWSFQAELLAMESAWFDGLDIEIKPGEYLGRTRWLTGWRSEHDG